MGLRPRDESIQFYLLRSEGGVNFVSQLNLGGRLEGIGTSLGFCATYDVEGGQGGRMCGVQLSRQGLD